MERVVGSDLARMDGRNPGWQKREERWMEWRNI